ncbi:hypothetical protein [Oxalobacter formigenes]|uniref:hypothetical protein n=1 Tax=Oxalobacter formigenes TaxID=847 RepID=UPI00241F4424|nr:hypothetical protein [Oxalobacter formigenes]
MDSFNGLGKQPEQSTRRYLSGMLKVVLPVAVLGILIWPSFGLAPLYAADAASVAKGSTMEKVKTSPEVAAILNVFPAGSIDSIEKADQVLEIVSIEKKNVEARLFNDKLDCNKKFLVYQCYDRALETKWVDLKELHALEVEAKRFKRSEDVRQRDLALDKRKADEIADAPKRAENVQAHEARVKRVEQKEAERAAAARGVSSTPGQKHSGALMTPAERAANVQKYEEKVETSQERQKIVEQKKAETQSKRDKKAREDAAKAESDRKKAE